MSPVSDEQTLAAKSAEILAMPRRAPKSSLVSKLRQKPEPRVEDGPEPPRRPSSVTRTRNPRPTSSGPVPFRAPTGGDHAETDQLLTSILEQLRRMQKKEMFGEFSLMRLLAGIVQVFVPFCLLLALWFLTGSRRQDNNVFLALGFAAVLQVMALTFYIMHGRR